jgi:N-acetylneuraminic acid mutarotase
VTQRTIMFGGFADPGGEVVFSDTWAYDATANTWTNLNPSGAVPPARAAHMMAYDPVARLMIVFGGWEDGGTWAYDSASNTWVDLAPSGSPPGARWVASMTYDSSIGRIVMFGGADKAGDRSDTWAYDSRDNRWTELNSETHPSARFNPCMAYDPSTERVIMFGGAAKSGDRSDTWACTP